jgi:glycosyltransferase involved in cell wall biosynthesis
MLVKVLLLSAYDTPSHRFWCTALQQQFTDVDWTYLSLPGRYFSWRIRGNALTWSIREAQVLSQQYDRVLATSMTDLATLRGLCPALTSAVNILYFHENQFAYPLTASAHASVEPQMVTLYSALCADRLVFNSDYNRQTFLRGVDQLMRQLPDEVPPGIALALTAKATVLPVPLAEPVGAAQPLKSASLPLEIVWNHRWEYDKGPEQLLAQVRALPAELRLKFHVLGQQFRQQPPEFAELRQLLEARGWLGRWGYVADQQAYFALLRQSHAVLSTAHHDFQGLAVLEAVAYGCVPLVPKRLVYPEWFGAEACYAEPPQTGPTLSERIIAMHDALAQGVVAAPVDVSRFSWPALRPQYQALLT